MHYFAIFTPAREGGHAITFPDIPEALSQGDTLEECMENARDVLADSLGEYAAERRELPAPSTYEQVQEQARALRAEPGVDPDRPQLLQLIHAPAVDRTPVRINISLPKFALEVLDRLARARGMSRSAFIAETALQAAGRGEHAAA